MPRLTFLLLLALTLPCIVTAQSHSAPLSEAEEEQVRDAAAVPAERVLVFQKIIESRVKRIQTVLADARAQGRREDIRESMDAIASLVDELQENMDEYDAAHRDLRKPLPKLLDAIPRWESVLRQAPDDPGYDVLRKLALDAVADVKQQSIDMLAAQGKYFKEHPPNKDANPGGVGQIHPE